MKKLILTITTLLLFSCAKEEFHSPNTVTSTTAESTDSFQNQKCADFTHVRPPVDMLFLWDNSTSSVFLNNQAKAGLNNIINYISDRFDYNVMIAPLLGSGNSDSVFFSRSGHHPGSGITTIQKEHASNYLDQFQKVSGSAENGLTRARDILAANQTNNVFRKDAYTIIVVVSNDDDNSWEEDNCSYCFNPGRRNSYVQGVTHDLLCMRGNYTPEAGDHTSFSRFNSSCSDAPKLNSTMMRFLSISALRNQSSCSISSQLTENFVYKSSSSKIYSEPYTNGFTFMQSVVTSPFEGPDAFDICTGKYTQVFDSINNVISDATLGHEYKYWPVAEVGTEVDRNTLKITKSNGSVFTEIDESITIVRDPDGTEDKDSNGQPINGFRFLSGSNEVNTRYKPTVGEPYSGQVIELFGKAKVKFPSCLLVQYSTVIKYFGYYQLDNRPDEDDITITINGQNIPKSETNGWTLVKEGDSPKYLTNFNVRVEGPGSSTPKTPAISQTGYFIKLNGSAVYKSGDKIHVNYGRSAE